MDSATPILALPLPARVARLLLGAGFKTAGELHQAADDALFDIRGLGVPEVIGVRRLVGGWGINSIGDGEPLSGLPFSKRARDTLVGGPFKTVGDLRRATDAQLRQVPHLGPMLMVEIRRIVGWAES